MPEDGVFAALVRLGDDLDSVWGGKSARKAAVSIGRTETFAGGHWQIEAYLLDYRGEQSSLYGQHMMMSPVERIRPQQRFATPADLTRAIEADCQAVRQVLGRGRKKA